MNRWMIALFARYVPRPRGGAGQLLLCWDLVCGLSGQTGQALRNAPPPLSLHADLQFTQAHCHYA